MCAHSSYGNREILGSVGKHPGPHREGEEPKPMTNGPKKSDLAEVAGKPTNKAGIQTAAEPVEPRAGAEGNVNGMSTNSTPSSPNRNCIG